MEKILNKKDPLFFYEESVSLKILDETYSVTLITPTAPLVAWLNWWVTNEYSPGSFTVNSTTAPPLAGNITVCMPSIWLAGLPSMYTSSIIEPITWKELTSFGPTLFTYSLILSPAFASSGASLTAVVVPFVLGCPL